MITDDQDQQVPLAIIVIILPQKNNLWGSTNWFLGTLVEWNIETTKNEWNNYYYQGFA